MTATDSAPIYCDYCGEEQLSVPFTNPEPDTYICSSCIDFRNQVRGTVVPGGVKTASPPASAPTTSAAPTASAAPTKQCSFCGNGHPQVPFVIAGPGVHICNECVQWCDDMLVDNVQKTFTDKYKCGFCGMTQADKPGKRVICGPGVYICDGCTERCNKIIAEQRSSSSAQVLNF